MPACCQHRADDRFENLLGTSRGSGRPDRPEDRPLPGPGLPYRTVAHRSNERNYDPVDALVSSCERCGDTGLALYRDWDNPALPAMCADCHEELKTAVATIDQFGCEDWCDTADLDHTGLCRP